MADVQNDKWIRRFEVTDPKKHKKGFTVYKVTSVVFPKSAPEASTCIVVWKRYNDFKNLYKNLKYYHKQWNIKEDLPQIYKGKYFQRFDENVIKNRMSFALELLNFIGRHQSLFTSESFLQFFNNGYQVSEIPDDNSFHNNESTFNFIINSAEDAEIKRNGLDKELCSSKSSNESTSVDSQCSDEDSTLTSNTPESLSPINSKKKFEISDTYNSNILSIVMNEVGCASPFLSGNPNHLESKECIKVDLNSSPSAPVSITNLKSLTVEETTDVKSSSIFRRLEDFSVSDSIQSPHLSDRNSRSTPQDATTCRQDYLVQAAYHVGQAQKCEVEEEFEAAFCFYKAAIACLMNGVQDDEEEVRRQAVKEKANQYLQRAEKIYAMHLAQNSEIGLTRTSAFEELKIYKVLRIIDSVMLALNTSDGKCYVIKVLQKSPCPINVKKKTTIPYNVPYMVKLHKYFENENSIFLVLQYAKRGKLWDHLFDPSKSNLFWNKEGSIQFSSSRFQLKKTFGNDFKRHCCVPGVEPSSKHIVSVKDYEGTNNCTQDLHSEKNKIVSSIEPLQYEEKSLDKYEKNERNIEEKEEAGAVNAEALEVTSLVENSQRLLNSVNKTLKNSEKLTNNLNKELTDIETVFDFKCKLIMSDELSINMNSKNKKKRSRSAVEKSHSSEDLTDSRPRTTSNSVDRRSEWLRVACPRLSESVVRIWAAQILIALETLHRYGIICRDLHPGNILVGDRGNVLLTFQTNWIGVDLLMSEEAITGFYAAPEIMSVFPITPAVDWWSFGALLHELLTGKAISSCYPQGISGHTILTFPEFLSPEACSLLTELLKYEPSERLGSSVNGAEDIKCHPFFDFVDWQLLYDD